MPSEITQSDREAAASIAVLAEMREHILAGRFDDHPYVQAFARHRLAERARVVAWLVGLHWTHRHKQASEVFAQAIADGECGG